MNIMVKFGRLFSMMCAALCVMSLSAVAQTDGQLNVIAPERDFPRVWRAYPEMDARYSRTGVSRSIAQVRRVQIGSSKRQVVGLFGQPFAAQRDGSLHFNVKLRLPQGNRLICQYRVYFDQNEQVSGTAWRRPQCANIVLGRGR